MTCTPASGTLFPNGRTIVTCTAKDAHGNQASKSLTISLLSAAAQLSATS